MVLLTEGYTSPFFIFFMFLLLSAAIRWGWRETALTAVLVTVLYLIVGLIAVKRQTAISNSIASWSAPAIWSFCR